MVDQDSHIIQNTKVYPNSLQHEPADYVSKAELKHLFDLLIKEKANDIQNEKVKEKDFQEEKQITYTVDAFVIALVKKSKFSRILIHDFQAF